MTRNTPQSFLEITINPDEIRKHVGSPIIYHHLENGESFLVSGILEDVSKDQIHVDKLSLLVDENNESSYGNEKITDEDLWIIHGSDFKKKSGENPLLFKHIKFIYVSKNHNTLEEMQSIILNHLKQ